MKKLLLLFLVLPFVFGSCSSDDDLNPDSVEKTILGKWKVQSIEITEIKTSNNEIAIPYLKGDVMRAENSVWDLSLTDRLYITYTNKEFLETVMTLDNNYMTSALGKGIYTLSGDTLIIDMDQTDFYFYYFYNVFLEPMDISVSSVHTIYTLKRV